MILLTFSLWHWLAQQGGGGGGGGLQTSVPIWAQLGIAAPAYAACFLLWKANSAQVDRLTQEHAVTVGLKDKEIADLNDAMLRRTDEQASRERESVRQMGWVVQHATSAVEAVPDRLKRERQLSESDRERAQGLLDELRGFLDKPS